MSRETEYDADVLAWIGVARVRALRGEIRKADLDRRSRHDRQDDEVRRRANELTDAAFEIRSRSLDLARYLNRLVTCQQMAAASICTVETHVNRLILEPVLARSLGTVLGEIVHFLDRGVSEGGGVGLLLATSFDNGFILMTVAVYGDFNTVASASGMTTLHRAARISRLLGGALARKVEEDHMIVAVAVPASRLTSRSE